MSNTLGTYLRTLRKQHNYTQDEMAQQLGVKRQIYSHYETGRVKPSFSVLCKIANFYNLPVEVLAEATGEISTCESSREEKLYHLSEGEQNLIRFYRQIDKNEQEIITAFTEFLAKKKRDI